MAISTNERKNAGRQALAWLSFAIFLVVIMGYGVVFFFRDVPAYFGYDMQRPLSGWEVVGTTVAAILVMCALVYVTAVCWLIFAKMFFTRTEVSNVVLYGMTTRVERWLVDKLFSQGGRGNRG